MMVRMRMKSRHLAKHFCCDLTVAGLAAAAAAGGGGKRSHQSHAAAM
jgi:hypothetical protein